MSRYIDETGNRYGQLEVVKYAYIKYRYAHWWCECDCGEYIIVDGHNLRRGNTKSCGCYNRDIASQIHKGKIVSKETRRKISTSLKRIGHRPPSTKGTKRSEDSNRKTSQSLMGHSVSDETREKLRKARLKQVLSKKDTSIELALQKRLDTLGIKYIKHLPVCGVCQPDIVFPEMKVAIFADGDYWHSKDFKNGVVWKRDKRINNTLKENGWDVLRFWGSEIRENLDECMEEVLCKIH